MTLEERLKSHDENTYQELIALHGKLVWAICGSILKNVGTIQDTEECVADVFIEIWKKPEKFCSDKGDIKVFLKILARTKALNTYKRLKRNSSFSLNEEITEASDILEDNVIGQLGAEKIMSAVDGLKEPDREICYRRYCFGQKPKEIAHAMKLPEREVRNRLYQSKLKLKNRLGDECYET